MMQQSSSEVNVGDNNISDDAALNGQLSARTAVDTAAMDWSASPSGTVWRKRLHRVGPAESGQVTSVVRYEPGATFPPHDHPDGEEILVLDGVFSDEHGNWPAGTYLLNPEGFRHAPFSQPGCTLLVKLRQYPGTDRQQLQLKTRQMKWLGTGREGVLYKSLYRQEGFSDHMRLEKWDADTARQQLNWSNGVEIFVIEGTFEDEEGCYRAGSWLRLPAGSIHRPGSSPGCELYIKEGGFTYLQGS